MPLHRFDDAYHPVFDGVLFQMTPGINRIVYRVSREALQDRAAADGVDHTSELVEIFLKHRAEIEHIASEKYDAVDAERLVSTADLNLLRHADVYRP
jgi:hypothetical protein